MATINAYFFPSLQSCNAKIAEINAGENLPNNGFLTTAYCEALPCVGGYYIIHDEITSKYCINLTTITNNDRVL
jgi:hypothetical protein